ncbi:hypothetical protein M8J76_012602 [Diaphorina citri]|nr:hypothetical protein M8J76_012602 [Diaphorina citri]
MSESTAVYKGPYPPDHPEDPSDLKMDKLYETKLKYPLLPWSLLLISKLFSTLPLDITIQGGVTAKYNVFQLIYSIVVIVGTVYHIYITPYVFNSLQYEAEEFNITSSSVYYRTVQISFPIVISVAALVSKFTTLFMLRKYIMKLYKSLYYSDLYNSTIFIDSNVRFLQLYESHVTIINILYFNYMYFSSIQVYITELQFLILAYGLYIRFQDINLYLYDVIRANSVFYNSNYKKEYFYTKLLVKDCTKPPPRSVLRSTKLGPVPNASSVMDAYSLNLKCNTVSNLRTAHIFLCDSLVYLNSIYDYSLMFSLVCLFITTLLDIYYEFFGIVVNEEGHTQIRTYLWIIQYIVRFISVIQMCDITSGEAKKARSLIANICNRHLDVNTKEELMLFTNHISSRNIEFSAGGFFNLNTHLITSAIAAGTTYLVILVQFNSASDNKD